MSDSMIRYDNGAELLVVDGEVWATQAELAKVFEVERSVVAKHLDAALADGEIADGDKRKRGFVHGMHKSPQGRPPTEYSLEAAIAVGYRVSSKRGAATQENGVGARGGS